MRGLEESRMGKGQTRGHRDSMKESAEGRFFEKDNFKRQVFAVNFDPRPEMQNVIFFTPTNLIPSLVISRQN